MSIRWTMLFGLLLVVFLLLGVPYLPDQIKSFKWNRDLFAPTNLLDSYTGDFKISGNKPDKLLEYTFSPDNEDIEKRYLGVARAKQRLAQQIPQTAAAHEEQTKTEFVPEAWVVQIGSFLEDARATAFANKYTEQNLPVFSQNIVTDQGRVTRILIGPYLVKNQAVNLLEKLQNNSNINGVVTNYQPIAE